MLEWWQVMVAPGPIWARDQPRGRRPAGWPRRWTAQSGPSLDWGAAEHFGGLGGHVGNAWDEVDKEYLAGSGEGRSLKYNSLWLVITRGSDFENEPLKS
jgi:hypothetical protein